MKKKLTGVVAGAAGAALLFSGATYALWSDNATVDGGTITAGNLDVAAVGGQWQDVSDDRTDSPHGIDLATFHIVPGDTIQGTFGIDVGLEGDNMLAQFALSGGGLTGDLAAGLEATYTVLDGAGTVVASGTGGVADGISVVLASSDNPAPGSALVVPATVDSTADFTLQVDVTFDAATTGQDLVQTQAALADAGVALTQVRTGDGFN